MSHREFNFDLDRMKASIESGIVRMPRGLTHHQRRQFIRDHLKHDLPKGSSPEEIVRGLVNG